jgi:hypothetical protein
MDPYVSTIVKKSALIAGGFALAGVTFALFYGLMQYLNLQHAMTLNMMPSQLS